MPLNDYLVLVLIVTAFVLNLLPLVNVRFYEKKITFTEVNTTALAKYGLWTTCVEVDSDINVPTVVGDLKNGCINNQQDSCTAGTNANAACYLFATSLDTNGKLILSKNKGHGWTIMKVLVIFANVLLASSVVLHIVSTVSLRSSVAKNNSPSPVGTQTGSINRGTLGLALGLVAAIVLYDFFAVKKLFSPPVSFDRTVAGLIQTDNKNIKVGDKNSKQMILWIVSLPLIFIALVLSGISSTPQAEVVS
jgi:hypothetical protein